MYARIMAAIGEDFSRSNVLDTAIGLARMSGAKLALCYALDETPLASKAAQTALPEGVAPVEAHLRESASEFLNAALSKAQEAGVEAEVIVVESEDRHVADMLARAASEWKADLLIAGAHSKASLEHLFSASIAEQLVRKAKTSLFLVRPH